MNLPIAIACIFNSYAWGCYAYIVKDIFVFIPNVAAFGAGVINISLYMWTTGSLKDSSLPIKILHRCCNKQAKMLPDKVKDDLEIENADKFMVKLEPEDDDSHIRILREDSKLADDGEEHSDHDEMDDIQVNLD